MIDGMVAQFISSITLHQISLKVPVVTQNLMIGRYSVFANVILEPELESINCSLLSVHHVSIMESDLLSFRGL